MNVGEILLDHGELDEIERIHRESGFDFKLPDFQGNPRFPIQLSVRHQGNFMAAALGKIDCEIYLFVNRQASTPRDRYTGLRMLHEHLVNYARRLGFDQIYCVLPPQVEKSFGPRLREAGWQRDRGWIRYVYEL